MYWQDGLQTIEIPGCSFLDQIVVDQPGVSGRSVFQIGAIANRTGKRQQGITSGGDGIPAKRLESAPGQGKSMAYDCDPLDRRRRKQKSDISQRELITGGNRLRKDKVIPLSEVFLHDPGKDIIHLRRCIGGESPMDGFREDVCLNDRGSGFRRVGGAGGEQWIGRHQEPRFQNLQFKPPILGT